MTSDITFTIGEVAKSLGVTPHAIRAWERRYGLPPPARRSGQRTYTPEDVDLLLRVNYAITVNSRSLKLAVLEAQGLLADEIGDAPEVLDDRIVVDRRDDASGLPWQRIADAIPRVLLIVDSEGVIVDCNTATGRALDTVREQLRNTRLTDHVIDYDRAKAARLFRPHLRAVRGWELRLRTRRVHQTVMRFDTHRLARPTGNLLALLGPTVLRLD